MAALYVWAVLLNSLVVGAWTLCKRDPWPPRLTGVSVGTLEETFT